MIRHRSHGNDKIRLNILKYYELLPASGPLRGTAGQEQGRVRQLRVMTSQEQARFPENDN
jgi:hypothetical protein